MQKRVGSLLITLILAAGFILAVTTKEAHAYIDIGSASMMLQILLATVFGALFSIKVFWRRITDNVSRFYAKVRRTNEPVE